jgi:pimeloyl-ACP methyl ester carboxylesterase
MTALAANAPLEMDRISFRIRGIECVGADQGPGEPLLLIHGWGGGATNWRRVWPHLATRYRCLAPEMPGWGDSEKPKVSYTFEWYADWLADFLQARDASPALVAGHSMGGTIAAVFAMRHPARVRKLALLNPIIRGSDGVKKESRVLSAPGLRRIAFWMTRSRRFLRYITRNFTELTEGMDLQDMLLVGRGTFRSMIRSLGALKSVDLTSSLPSIAVPTLIIGADRDREVPKEQSELARGIPGSRLEMLKGCGHVSPLERPEEVASLLIDFFGVGARRARPPQW